MKLLFARLFNRKLYRRFIESLSWKSRRIKVYEKRIAKGEINKDDILAYLYYYQDGSWDELIERFGKTRVKQYEAMGLLKHYDKNGLLI